MILLGEQVLSPVWTYLGVGEAPSHWTLVGGALLIATLAAHEGAALVEEWRDRRKATGDDDAATGDEAAAAKGKEVHPETVNT